MPRNSDEILVNKIRFHFYCGKWHQDLWSHKSTPVTILLSSFRISCSRTYVCVCQSICIYLYFECAPLFSLVAHCDDLIFSATEIKSNCINIFNVNGNYVNDSNCIHLQFDRIEDGIKWNVWMYGLFSVEIIRQIGANKK